MTELYREYRTSAVILIAMNNGINISKDDSSLERKIALYENTTEHGKWHLFGKLATRAYSRYGMGKRRYGLFFTRKRTCLYRKSEIVG